jgi:hypothetical protein
MQCRDGERPRIELTSLSPVPVVFGSEEAEAREGAKKREREKKTKSVRHWPGGGGVEAGQPDSRARGRSTTRYHLHSTLLVPTATNDRRVRASARLHGRVIAAEEGSAAGNPAMLAF